MRCGGSEYGLKPSGRRRLLTRIQPMAGRCFEAPFSEGFSPDVVLIDGRFRVACFLYALIHTKPGTVIIFDDYADRPEYHVVEEVISPVEVDQRQAKFVRPNGELSKAAAHLLDKFEFVMD